MKIDQVKQTVYSILTFFPFMLLKKFHKYRKYRTLFTFSCLFHSSISFFIIKLSLCLLIIQLQPEVFGLIMNNLSFLFLCKSYCSNNNISLYYFFNMTPKGKVTGKDIVSLFTKDLGVDFQKQTNAQEQKTVHQQSLFDQLSR